VEGGRWIDGEIGIVGYMYYGIDGLKVREYTS
jgi:hypothetical protein